jgi:periplasmic protein CpxP/Spy
VGLALTSGAMAQDCGAKGQMGDKASAMHDHLQEMGKQLNLTDDQKEKLKPIMTSQMQDMAAVKSDTTMTPPQKRAKMMEIHQKYASQIDAILTPEQQAKWKTMRREMMEKHKGEMGGGGMSHDEMK